MILGVLKEGTVWRLGIACVSLRWIHVWLKMAMIWSVPSVFQKIWEKKEKLWLLDSAFYCLSKHISMLKVFPIFQTITKYLQNISCYLVAVLMLTVRVKVTGNCACQVSLKIG